MSNFLDHLSQRVLLRDGASRGKRARALSAHKNRRSIAK